MLTAEQRAELEALGAENVRIKLIHGGAGRGADVPGFKTGRNGGGNLTRGDVEDWLAGKHTQEESRQNSTLLWARIAGWASIIGIAVAIAIAFWQGK